MSRLRTVSTNLTYQPEIASWFDPRYTLNTSYRTNRNPSYVTSLTADGDSLLVRDLGLRRDQTLDIDVDPTAFLTMLGVPQARSADGLAAGIRTVWDRIRPLRLGWSRTVEATYDRRNLDPSFSDQLVLDGFETLRFLSGADTASSAGTRRRFQLRTGLDLPLNLDVETDYSTSTITSFTQRTRRSTEDTGWPSVTVRWRGVPVPGFLDGRVNTITLTGQWRVRDRVTRTTTGQDQGSESLERSLVLTFVFRNGFNLSYELRNSVTERTDGSGFSESNRNGHTVRGTGTVPPPSFLGFVRNPVRLTAEVVLNGSTDCRELGGQGFSGTADPVGLGAGCVDHLDQTQNTIRLAADTDFSGYGIGVQFQWVRRASGVGTRQTSNQYNFDVFGRFFLQSRTSDLPADRPLTRP